MKKISKLSALTLAVLLSTVSAFAGSNDGDHAAAEGSAPRSRSPSPAARGETATPDAAAAPQSSPALLELSHLSQQVQDFLSPQLSHDAPPLSPREELMKEAFSKASLESGSVPHYLYAPSTYGPRFQEWIDAAVQRRGPTEDNGLWAQLCYDNTPHSLAQLVGLKNSGQRHMETAIRSFAFLAEMSERLGGDPLTALQDQRKELDEAEENLKELKAQVAATQEQIDAAIAGKEGFQGRLEAWRDELVGLQAESRRALTPAAKLMSLTPSSPFVYAGSDDVSLQDILQQAIKYKAPSRLLKSTESVQRMGEIFLAIQGEVAQIPGLKKLLKDEPRQMDEFHATDATISQALQTLDYDEGDFEGACLAARDGLKDAELYNRRLIIEYYLAHPLYRPFLWDLLIDHVKQVAHILSPDEIERYAYTLKEHLDAPGRWGEERVAAYYFGWSTEHTRPVLHELRTPPASPRDGEGDAAAAPRTPTPTLPAEGQDWDAGRPDAAAGSDVRPTSPVVAEELQMFEGVALPSAHHALLSEVFAGFETVGVPNSSEPSKSKAHTNQRYTYRAMAEILKARGATTLELPTRLGGWTSALTGANVQATLAEAIRVIPEGELADFKAAIALGVEQIKAARLQKTDGASASTDK